MTAPSLRARIAAAWSDHETGTLRPEGYVPCRCGQRFTSPQALSEHRASVMLAVLADADPTDALWGLVWRRLGTARPRTEETPDAG